MIRRTAKIIGLTLTGIGAVALAAGGLFAWRLSQGPVALDPLIPYVERALSDRDGRFQVDIGELVLSLEEEDGLEAAGRRLDLRARRVQALNADGTELAAVPEMGIGFSIPALFRGTLSPTRLDLVRPRLSVLRRADGSLAFDVRSDAQSTRKAEDGSPDLIDEALESLRQPPDIDRPLGLLRRLSVTGADLRVENRMLDLAWHATRADMVLTRDAEGAQGRARVTLDLGNAGGTAPQRAVTVSAAGRYNIADTTSDLTVSIDGLEPAALAEFGPALAPLSAVKLPLSGTITARLDRRFEPLTVDLNLRGGAGTVALPALRPEPVAVPSLALRGKLDVPGRRLQVEDLSLKAGAPDGGEPLALSAQGQLAETDRGRDLQARLSLTAGGRTAGLELSGQQGLDKAGRATARLTGFVPAAFADLAPLLAPLKAAELPLSGTVEAAFDPSFQPTAGKADIVADRGRLLRPDLFEGPVPVDRARLRLHGDRDRIELDGFEAVLGEAGGPQPRVEATATARREGNRMAVETQATAHGVALDELRRYWPTVAGPNAREWVTRNLSHGTVTQARAEAALSVPLDGQGKPSGEPPEQTRFLATIAGEDISVRYFHNLTPVTGASVEATTDGKTFTVLTKGGRIADAKSGDIEVGDGKVVIGGLDIGKETMDIRLPVQGPVRSILTLIDMPPLGYPTKLEMDPARTQGTAEAKLHFAFPLLADLKVEQLDLDVTGKLRKVAVEKVAAGMNATDGELSLALDLKAMQIKGATKLDGIPVTIDWNESFDSAAKGPRTRIAVKGDATADDLRAHGIDLEDRVQGSFGADILFTVDRKHKLLLTGALNLEKTRLSIEELGWAKPPGKPGTGKLTLEFDKDRPTRISNLTIDAGGLKSVTNLELADGGKRVARVQTPSFKLGQTDLRADLTVLPPLKPGGPTGGYAGTITGTSLDARGLTGKTPSGEGAVTPPPKKPPSPADDGRKTPLDIAIKFDSVVFGDGRRLRQVAGSMKRDASAWTLLDLTGRSEGGGVSLKWRPGPQGVYDLAINAEDLGSALQAMDLNDRMRGGRLTLTGRSAEARADAAIVGKAEIRDYTLIDVPALARILNAISPSGFAELLGGGKGVAFGRMSADFRKEGRLLTLKDLRTSGSALGLTLEGQIDLETETANLQGTIVPVYGLNRLIGQIPLLGDVLSGGEGQGIFSATWHVQGPLSDPDVSVNPLAVLAPGFLRNLFFLGGDGTPTPDTKPPPESHMR
ncbi:YhdP family protein [Azospirillum palustre]